jgi:hypothetical protein
MGPTSTEAATQAGRLFSGVSAAFGTANQSTTMTVWSEYC